MRLPNLVRASVGVLLLVVLSGCTPSDAIAPPEPTATFVAPYATDEEALAAAEAAYAEYLRVINEALRTGNVDKSALEAVTAGTELTDALDVYSGIAAEGKRSTADITYDQVVLQRYSRDGSPSEVITIYACEDLSEAFLVDSDGKRVREDDIPPRTMQLTFDYTAPADGLRLSDRQVWDEAPC